MTKSRGGALVADSVVAGAGDVVLLRPLVHPPGSLVAAMAAADVRCANLEVPLTDTVDPQRGEGVVLRGAASLLDDLASLRLDVVGLANNHIADQGWAAVRGVIDGITTRGQLPVGAGEHEPAAWRPVIRDQVAFLAVTSIPPWSAGGHIAAVETESDLDQLRSAVEEAKRATAKVVILLHGGTPHVARATEWQREVARAAIGAGASVVFGAHAHVPQGIEVIADVPVFYGLGSLVFQYDGPNWERFERDSLVAVVELDSEGRATSAQLVVGRVDSHGEAVHTDAEHARQVLEHLREASLGWASELHLDGDRITVAL